MSDEESYDGIAVPDLRIDSVEWTAEQSEHIRTTGEGIRVVGRSQAAGRKGGRTDEGEHR
jgi:hypothetical protein